MKLENFFFGRCQISAEVSFHLEIGSLYRHHYACALRICDGSGIGTEGPHKKAHLS